MDTLRVDIRYRPVRIGWVILSTDLAAFRRAVRLSYALSGGRFNPILFADRPTDARQLIEIFRVDVLWPIGDSSTVKEFSKAFPHLRKPGFGDDIFSQGSPSGKRAQFLDVLNTFTHVREKAAWKSTKEREFRAYSWQADDPLADIFLIQFGAFPDAAETGPDFHKVFLRETGAADFPLLADKPLPADIPNHPGPAFISRLGVDRHYSIQTRSDHPGFYVGDTRSLDDLAFHWNLRAADLAMWFVDVNELARYADLIPAWHKRLSEPLARGRTRSHALAMWSRSEPSEAVTKVFAGLSHVRCQASEHTWNGLNLVAPLMYLDDASVLGVVSSDRTRPKVSFQLMNKPFNDDAWFGQQRFVASFSFLSGLYDDEQHTLEPPYIPELNDFYGRIMHFDPSRFRIEPDGIGIILHVFDHDVSLNALPVALLFERVFEMAGYTTRLGPGGLIVRQLISSLHGLQGARVFKIPGVRRLLKTHASNASLSKREAVNLIAARDPENPKANFNDHLDLHIEARSSTANLTPQDVFAHLVENGLYRIGVEVICPHCRLPSWLSIDILKQRVTCEKCGKEHDATRQLVDAEWKFRRSGVLGVEKNAQGSVPVALTLQQLDTTFHGLGDANVYSPSLELTPLGGRQLHKCEVDFVWMARPPHSQPNKTMVILAECKDQMAIDVIDMEHLREVAAAFPAERFQVFILLAKLRPFTSDEIAYARTLNEDHSCRVILLTARELEPYFIYERTKKEHTFTERTHGPEDLARVTAEIYFPATAACPPMNPLRYGRNRLLRLFTRKIKRMEDSVRG